MKYTLTIESSDPQELVALLNGETDFKQAVKKTTTVKKPEPEQEPDDEDEITIEKIRSLAAEKSQEGHKDAIKALLPKFKITKIPDLKETQYVKFYDALSKLTH